MAIKGLHAMFNSTDWEELQRFFRDTLGLEYSDVGGALFFSTPEVEIACHPAEGDDTSHEISFYCDDLESTVADLRAKGVTFGSDIDELPWGSVISMQMPGGVQALLYQPKYTKTSA